MKTSLKNRLYARVTVVAALLGSCLGAQMAAPPKAETRAWLVRKDLSPDERADLVIAQMTLDEKIQMVHGAGMSGFPGGEPSLVRANGGGGFVPGIERLGLPDLNMADSAVGVGRGALKGRYSTALPSTLALASSWDKNVAHEFGALIGRELADQGYNVSLAGGVDITREPRNGRNFEYQGEDPILAGNMVAQLIMGLQAQGVIGDIKHYALNDEETGRMFANASLDRRSMRESDLLAFEIGVKQAKPGMVMCSYNLINGTYACENDYTLNQVLKKEWGFQGWVISDWFATHSTSKAALAGLDQQQPTGNFFGEALKKAVESGEVPLTRLNDMVHRIVRTEFACGIIDKPQPTMVPDAFHGQEIARRVEEASAVLLKNDGGQLPLNPAGIKSIAVIGSHAGVGVLSGGGSAQVDPAGGNAVPQAPFDPTDIMAFFAQEIWHRSSPYKAIREMVPGAEVTYDAGTDYAIAAAKAKAAEVAIVFVNQHTSENSDVETLALPDKQDALVNAVVTANPHTIVVVESGGPVLMPWAGRVKAILEAWYPGIGGGEAIANLLFGKVNPSGKTAVTFPQSDADLPHPVLPGTGVSMPNPFADLNNFPAFSFVIHYDEGLKVGYRWYESEGKKPLFPFGYGLSYTKFLYAGMQADGGDGLNLSFAVQNVGMRAGEEVAQVYVTYPRAAGEPGKKLVGWEKISLAAGETKSVKIRVDPMYVSVFDVQQDKWKIVPGDYTVQAGGSSVDLPLKAVVGMGK